MAVKVGDIIISSLYLSIYDKNFRILPTDPIELEILLHSYIPLLNEVLQVESFRSPGIDVLFINANDAKRDYKLNLQYFDIQKNFCDICAVSTASGSVNYLVNRLGLASFLAISNTNSANYESAAYFFNKELRRLYVNISSTSFLHLNVVGQLFVTQENGEEFISISDDFPPWANTLFRLYIELYLASEICLRENVPFQQAKYDRLENYKVLLSNSNIMSYNTKVEPLHRINSVFDRDLNLR